MHNTLQLFKQSLSTRYVVIPTQTTLILPCKYVEWFLYFVLLSYVSRLMKLFSNQPCHFS